MRVVGGGGDHHLVEARPLRAAIEPEHAVLDADALDRIRGAHGVTAPPQPARGGDREELREVDTRDQQLARTGRRAEAVAQDVGKDLGRCLLDRGVQRRQAQRLPQALADARGLSGIEQQRARRAIPAEPPFAFLEVADQAHCGEAIGPVQAARAQQPEREVQRRGQARVLQMKAVDVANRHRQRFEHRGRDAHLAHQLQCLLVSTDQDVLPVVDVAVLARHHPRATAEHAASLEHGDSHFLRSGQRDRAGEARIAPADDRDLRFHARNQVVPASQILRSGVSEVRRSSTLKPSASISASSVR